MHQLLWRAQAQPDGLHPGLPCAEHAFWAGQQVRSTPTADLALRALSAVADLTNDQAGKH